MNNDKLIVITMRLEDIKEGDRVPGATESICCRCGAKVSLAPSALDVILEERVCEVVCVRCVTSEDIQKMKQGGVMSPTAKQWQEIAEWRRKHKAEGS